MNHTASLNREAIKSQLDCDLLRPHFSTALSPVKSARLIRGENSWRSARGYFKDVTVAAIRHKQILPGGPRSQ